MFILTLIRDTIRIKPTRFNDDLEKLLIETLDKKLANKIIPNVGLCLFVHHISKIGDGIIYAGDGASQTCVHAYVVVFRPYDGEVLEGTVVNCDKHGLKVSLEFFQNIIVPDYMIRNPSKFNSISEEWEWTYTEASDDEQDESVPLPEEACMTIKKGDRVRVRVAELRFSTIGPSAKGPGFTSETTSLSAARAVTAVLSRDSSATADTGDLPEQPPMRRQRSRSLSMEVQDPCKAPAPFEVLADIGADGLGPVHWWVEEDGDDSGAVGVDDDPEL